MKLVAAGVAGLTLIAALALGVVRLNTGNTAEQLVHAWLLALAGAEEDRGWHYLNEDTQQRRYGGDRDAYIADAAAADWSEFRWSIDPPYRHDDVIAWRVTVAVEGGLDSAPDFLVRRNLVHPACVDGDATGFGVWVDWDLLRGMRLGPGALTGSAGRGECSGGTDR